VELDLYETNVCLGKVPHVLECDNDFLPSHRAREAAHLHERFHPLKFAALCMDSFILPPEQNSMKERSTTLTTQISQQPDRLMCT
jgi:hypothetical protein